MLHAAAVQHDYVTLALTAGSQYNFSTRATDKKNKARHRNSTFHTWIARFPLKIAETRHIGHIPDNICSSGRPSVEATLKTKKPLLYIFPFKTVSKNDFPCFLADSLSDTKKTGPTLVSCRSRPYINPASPAAGKARISLSYSLYALVADFYYINPFIDSLDGEVVINRAAV